MNKEGNEVESLFKSVIGNVMKDAEKEINQNYGKDIDRIIASRTDWEDPQIVNTLICYPFDNILRTLVSKIHRSSNRKIFVVYRNYSFLTSNLQYLINSKEGPEYSVDKSKWIISSYVKYLKSAILPDMTIEEKCYWKPNFGTAIQWMKFCESLIALLYGNPQQYIYCLKDMGEG